MAKDEVMYKLKKRETHLGTFYPVGEGDFPWIYCRFVPMAAFTDEKPLFQRLWEYTETGQEDWDEAERIVLSIEKEFYLEDEEGNQVKRDIVQIHNNWGILR